MLRHFRLLEGDTGSNPQGGSSQAGDPPGTSPQAGTQSPPAPQAGSGTKTSDDYERIIADLRKENAGHRTKLKKFEDDDAQRQQASMSEQEKLQKQLADLQAAREADVARMLTAEINLTAAELGVNPQYLKRVAHMLDWEELDVDEATGDPKNIKELIGNLIKEMPFLTQRTGAAPSAGGATNPSRTTALQQGQITIDNLQEAMANYEKLTPAQQRQVQNLLIGRR